MTRQLVLSRHLRECDVTKLIDAAAYAYCIGQELNCHLTLHLDKARIAHSSAHRFFVHVMHSAATWVLRHTHKSIAYVYFVENPSLDNTRGGLHVHVLLHLPRTLRPQFRSRVARWVVNAGGHYEDKAVQLRPLYWSDTYDDEMYLRRGLIGLLTYLSKGLHPAVDNPLGTHRKPQGVVHGKRSGPSQSLRPALRTWTPERLERLALARQVFGYDVLPDANTTRLPTASVANQL